MQGRSTASTQPPCGATLLDRLWHQGLAPQIHRWRIGTRLAATMALAALVAVAFFMLLTLLAGTGVIASRWQDEVGIPNARPSWAAEGPREASAAIGGTYTLNSIAAVVIGGVSLAGGAGSAVGAVFGALVLRTMSPELADAHYALTRRRDRDDLVARYNTVDDAQSFAGLVATVFTLRDMGDVDPGQYGQADGASSVLPPPP